MFGPQILSLQPLILGQGECTSSIRLQAEVVVVRYDRVKERSYINGQKALTESTESFSNIYKGTALQRRLVHYSFMPA